MPALVAIDVEPIWRSSRDVTCNLQWPGTLSILELSRSEVGDV